MSSYLTDEEQVDRLKNLIKTYGSTILSAVLLALIAFMGWNYWQKSQSAKLSMLSNQYDGVVVDGHALLSNLTDQTALTKFMTSSDALIKASPDSIFATYSLLLQAKVFNEKNDLVRAESTLKKVTDNGNVDDATRQIAWLRLARVQAAQNKLADALKALDNVKADGFVATAEELRGDYLLQTKNVDGAKKAYLAAWTLLTPREEVRPLLKIKMENLGMDVPEIKVSSPVLDQPAG